MAKKSDLIRHAEAQIKLLKINIKKYNEAIIRCKAEVKAYKNLIEWSETKDGNRPKSSSNKT